MLVGQQFGPFTIDKELGSGAMGTVYRGRFTKTGQVMAVKIMAPGIGTTNAVAADRFEREIAILKRLNHPNIVRLYGAGKHASMRYFAMEYIEGESLDKVMARRGRMTWEEVVELGKQLCSALQHSHGQGIIHRDLKPSNIMVLADGTLKLTDFGIAKGSDLETLTATNCTVGTAAYMSPEQCKGERNLKHKSDLYSLGVMFYELVTGRKPFRAENAMEMFMLHVSGKFERPSRQVLDIPIWFDTLICQLLEKEPEKRPLDARMVGNTLDTIQEKVEAQQSAGVEAVRRRMIDRAPGQKRLDEEDKDAARVLLTGKGKGKRKKTKKLFYQQVWFQGLGLVLALGVAASLLYLVFRPPSADKLYEQAKAVMRSGDVEKQEMAIEANGILMKYLGTSEGKQDTERSREVRGWRAQIQIEKWERLLDNYMQKERSKSVLKVQPEGRTQEAAFKAVQAEESGDRDAALRHWQTVKEIEGEDSSWARVVDKHVAEWQAVEQTDMQFKKMHNGIGSSSEEAEIHDERQREAFQAWRMEISDVGDKGLAKSLFKSIQEERAKEPGLRRLWYLYAAWHARSLNDKTPKKEKELKEDVLNQMEMKYAEFKNEKKIRKADVRLVCMDILALYGQNKEMSEAVEEAEKLLQEMAK
jgi:serine/threonine-protein kinase